LCFCSAAQVEALQRHDPWSKECHQLSTNTIHTGRKRKTWGFWRRKLEDGNINSEFKILKLNLAFLFKKCMRNTDFIQNGHN
jgi:hypothetical protein